MYEPFSSSDGTRILVDRVWPRGVSKAKASALWLKTVAPSTQLRKWFNHDPAKWPAFKVKYFEELNAGGEDLDLLLDLAEQGAITLVYSAKDELHNQAVALREYVVLRLS